MARKDARLMLEEAERHGLPLPMLPSIAANMDSYLARGHAHDDWTVLAKDALGAYPERGPRPLPPAGDAVVGVLRVEGAADSGLHLGEGSSDVGRQAEEQVVTNGGHAVERGQRFGEHRGDVDAAQREVEHHERLGEVGVELEQCSQRVLVDLGGGEDEPIQRAEERQQVEPHRFESSL